CGWGPVAPRGAPRAPLPAPLRGPAAGRDRVRPGSLDRRARPDRHELDPRRDQLPGPDLQDARAWDGAVPDADARLDGPHDVGPGPDGDPGDHERADHAVHRPQLR